MKITLRLYATLRDYLPPDTPGGQIRLDLPEAATVPAALASLAVPLALAHIVMVNGRHVLRPDLAHRPLHEGDELAVWPAIGGG
jgi:sulfur carrier protein ThiS